MQVKIIPTARNMPLPVIRSLLMCSIDSLLSVASLTDVFDLFTMAQVCSEWRKALCAHSALWVSIPLLFCEHAHHGIAIRALEWSSTQSILVRMTQCSACSQATETVSQPWRALTVMRQQLERLRPNCHRIIRLHLNLQGSPLAAQDVLQGLALPALQSLWISGSSRHTIDWDIVNGLTSTLHTLHVDMRLYPAASIACSNPRITRLDVAVTCQDDIDRAIQPFTQLRVLSIQVVGKHRVLRNQFVYPSINTVFGATSAATSAVLHGLEEVTVDFGRLNLGLRPTFTRYFETFHCISWRTTVFSLDLSWFRDTIGRVLLEIAPIIAFEITARSASPVPRSTYPGHPHPIESAVAAINIRAFGLDSRCRSLELKYNTTENGFSNFRRLTRWLNEFITSLSDLQDLTVSWPFLSMAAYKGISPLDTLTILGGGQDSAVQKSISPGFFETGINDAYRPPTTIYAMKWSADESQLVLQDKAVKLLAQSGCVGYEDGRLYGITPTGAPNEVSEDSDPEIFCYQTCSPRSPAADHYPLSSDLRLHSGHVHFLTSKTCSYSATSNGWII